MKNSIKFQNLDDLFKDLKSKDTEVEYKILEIELLIPFSKNRFNLYMGERFRDIVESVKEFGIIEPLIVRPIQCNKYEIIAGHNRWNAAKECGLNLIPAMVIKHLSDEEAQLLAAETNLIQRSFAELSHTEKALIIAEHYQLLKKNSRKDEFCNEVDKAVHMVVDTDNDLSQIDDAFPLETHGASYKKTAEEYQLSKSTVARYMRINALSQSAKELIDNDEISLRAGVELSYIPIELQDYLINNIKAKDFKIDIKKAKLLRVLHIKNILNKAKIDELILAVNNQQMPVNKGFKLKASTISRYFENNQSAKDIEKIILKALEQYFRSK